MVASGLTKKIEQYGHGRSVVRMAEVNLRELRTIVRECLDELKLKNDIRLSTVGFGGRGFARTVTIKDWNASLDGHKWSPLEHMIKERTRKFYDNLQSWFVIVEAD